MEPINHETMASCSIKSMTMREHFAILALQGILANGHIDMGNAKIYAKYAIKYADYLIVELNKEDSNEN